MLKHFSSRIPAVLKKSKLSQSNKMVADIAVTWPKIVGEEMAEMTLPYKITWLKRKNADGEQERIARLHILCPDALKTQIMFQEGVWLSRIHINLGMEVIQQIQTHRSDELAVISPSTSVTTPPSGRSEATHALSPLPYIDDIQDTDLRRSLNRIAQAIASRDQSC